MGILTFGAHTGVSYFAPVEVGLLWIWSLFVFYLLLSINKVAAPNPKPSRTFGASFT